MPHRIAPGEPAGESNVPVRKPMGQGWIGEGGVGHDESGARRGLGSLRAPPSPNVAAELFAPSVFTPASTVAGERLLAVEESRTPMSRRADLDHARAVAEARAGEVVALRADAVAEATAQARLAVVTQALRGLSASASVGMAVLASELHDADAGAEWWAEVSAHRQEENSWRGTRVGVGQRSQVLGSPPLSGLWTEPLHAERACVGGRRPNRAQQPTATSQPPVNMDAATAQPPVNMDAATAQPPVNTDAACREHGGGDAYPGSARAWGRDSGLRLSTFRDEADLAHAELALLGAELGAAARPVRGGAARHLGQRRAPHSAGLR